MRQPVHEQIPLPPGKAALLMIDIQEEQRSDANYRADGIDHVLSNGATLLSAARANGWLVGHVRYVRDFSLEPPRPFEATTDKGLPTFSAPEDGQTEICAEVAPLKDEAVFTKNDASAFKGTGLKDWLQHHEITWVILCGVWTEACVAATLRDAVATGFRVLLVKDSCASGTRLMHETAILNLANRLYGGGICDTARAASLLQGNTAPVWRLRDPVPLRFDDTNISSLYDNL